MATAKSAIEFYQKYLGLKEEPPGSNNNWITRMWGFQFPWCAATFTLSQYWAWDEGTINNRLPNGYGIKVPNVLYVPSWREGFINAGRYSKTPKVGDAVIYTWGPGTPIGDHIGIVEEVVGDGTIVALEGNDSNNAIGRHRRSMDVIDGFGHPFYEEVKPVIDKETVMSLSVRYIYKDQTPGSVGNLDWVFDGPSRIFAPVGALGILKACDACKFPELGVVDKDTHDWFSGVANGWRNG